MRRFIAFSGIFFFLFTGECFGQEEDAATLFGYIEPQFSIADINHETQQMSSLKVRLDLELLPSDKVSFQGNYNYITRHGDKTWYLLDFLSNDVKSDLFPGARELFVYRLEDEHYVDNVNLKIAFNLFDLTIGRQQISPGAGYAWNPTDIFNLKNPLDPTYEQRGHDALRADIPLGSKGTMTLLYSPEGDFDTSGKLTTLKYNIGHFDVTLMGGERLHKGKDYSTFTDLIETRKIAGGDISGELFGIGTWLELAWNDMEKSNNYFEGLVGFDYTFDSGLYVLNEFYRNEQGKSNYKDYNVFDWIKYFASETKSITRDQWFFYISYPATDLITVGSSLIASLNDRSMVLVPTVNYNLFENLDVTFFGNFYIGDEGKTFSPLLGQGGLVRLKYYF